MPGHNLVSLLPFVALCYCSLEHLKHVRATYPSEKTLLRCFHLDDKFPFREQPPLRVYRR